MEAGRPGGYAALEVRNGCGLARVLTVGGDRLTVAGKGIEASKMTLMVLVSVTGQRTVTSKDQES